MSVAVARGGRWLKWRVSKARRVLYIDGEMPAADLQARVRALCGDDVPELLELLPSEFFYGTEQQPFTLNNIEHQARLRLLLEQLAANQRRPEMIVFDNLSSMSFGVDENSNSEQDAALAFLRELRHLGHAVVLVHHAGKGGDQRGASRHEDFLDLSIKLAKPETETADSGAHFVLEFVKVRGKMPQPSSLDCVLAADQRGRLEWIFSEGKREPAKWVQVLKHVADKSPSTQKEVAVARGVSAATIGTHLERAREKGLLDGMVVTDAGQAYLRKVYAPKAEGGADDPEF
jgi:putative DNA primase/helicase